MADQNSPLKLAYEQANAIMKSRDGAGFRFIVTLNCGKSFDVVPLSGDPIIYPKDGLYFWECEHGENYLVLRHAEIAAIEVYEC